MSMGVKSVLAGGGVGALAFSLASKDLAQQMVGGLFSSSMGCIQGG